MPQCGLGNRLLYYYNLRQEAHHRGCDYFAIPFLGTELFVGNLTGAYPTLVEYELFEFYLGERFYRYNELSTREVFKLQTVPQVWPSWGKTCALHFRGGDFRSWNPRAILDTSYYCDSIDEIKKEATNFVLFSDDTSLESYSKVQKYLASQNLSFTLGDNNTNRRKYGHDFSIMSECDYIISSPSTYSICAGFIGKQKKIIHSQEWVKERVDEGDKFWVDLYEGGNDDYKIWKLI